MLKITKEYEELRKIHREWFLKLIKLYRDYYNDECFIIIEDTKDEYNEYKYNICVGNLNNYMTKHYEIVDYKTFLNEIKEIFPNIKIIEKVEERSICYIEV